MNLTRFFNLDYVCYLLLISMVSLFIQYRIPMNWHYSLGMLVGLIAQTITFFNYKKSQQ